MDAKAMLEQVRSRAVDGQVTKRELLWVVAMAREALAWRNWWENCGLEPHECSCEVPRAAIWREAQRTSDRLLAELEGA